MVKATAHTAPRAGKPVNRSQVTKDTAHRTQHARTLVNKRQVATDNAHTCAPSAGEGRETTN